MDGAAGSTAKHSIFERYDIVGETSGGGRRDARILLAKDRETGEPVFVVATHAPEGDEGNALSHLAADANLLAGASHRSLLPVKEGQWLSETEFGVVTARVSLPTLGDLLARRDEEFDYPRIARILGDLNALLEWARERRVVHRTLLPETIFVEPGSDRLCASFAAGPLPRSGVPGSSSDARTIAALARAMLTRSAADPERANQPLSELRPGLPAAVVEETEQLLRPDPAKETFDVPGYIARIAMADALKHGETHRADTHAEMTRLQEEHRAQLERERREHEEQLAKERKDHETRIEAERKKHEREMREAEREIETTRRELQKTHKEVTEARRLLPAAAVAALPVLPALPARRERPKPKKDTTASRQETPQPAQRRFRIDRNAAMGAAGVVLLIAGAALALGHRSSHPATTKSSSVVVDSSAGTVVAAPSPPSRKSIGGLPMDLVTGVLARSESATVVPEQDTEPVQRRSYFAPIERPRAQSAASPSRRADSSLPARDSAPKDSVTRGLMLPRALVSPDSLAKRDSALRARADSLLPRKDTVRVDTLAVTPR